MENKQHNTTDKTTSLPKELLADEELLCCVGGADEPTIVGLSTLGFSGDVNVIALSATFNIKVGALDV